MSNQRRIAVTASIVATLVYLTVTVLRAATPSSGTVTPPSTTLTYTGGPFANINPTGAAGPPDEPACVSTVFPCDDYALTVSIPAADPNVYFLTAGIAFPDPADDFDLYLYDSDGTLVTYSTNGAGVQEA